MALRSELFTKDPAVKARLEACAARDSDHIFLGAKGDHVSAIQAALFAILPGLQLPDDELGDTATGKGFYGPKTAAAVRLYKQNHRPPILNTKLHQTAPDDIVGILTIKFLDDDLVAKQPGPPPPVPPPTNQEIIDKAFDRSRKSLPVVSARLQNLANAINAANQLDGLQKIIAIQNLGRVFSRDIAVIADKLKTSSDPLGPEFKSALDNAIRLISQNLIATSGIIDEGNVGRCDPAHPGNNGVLPFAATIKSDPDPKVSACTPFFTQNDDMKRDVLTHEFFHLLDLADVNPIDTTADALNDANTMAQVVAYIHDRSRQVDSSGSTSPPHTYPTP